MANNMAKRDAPPRDEYVDDVYIHQGLSSKTKQKSVECFESRDRQLRQFWKHQYYFFQKHIKVVFHIKIPRILYLGDHSVNEGYEVGPKRYFPDQREFGFHLFINYAGIVSTIHCLRDTNQEIDCLEPNSINDILPRFHHTSYKTNMTQYMLLVGIEIKITDLIPQNNSLCHTNGFDNFYEHRRNKYSYNPFTDKANKFGVFVRRGAKLVLGEECRRCAGNPKTQHHIRTLVMSGGFLMIEGNIEFQLSNKGIGKHTKHELEDVLRLTIGTINSIDTPIFFLDALQPIKPRERSRVWYLQHQRAHGIYALEGWVLTIPQNASFEVHPYDSIGRHGVQTYQNQQPWYSEHYLETLPNVPQRYLRSERQVRLGINPEREWSERHWNTVMTMGTIRTFDISLNINDTRIANNISYARIRNAVYNRRRNAQLNENQYSFEYNQNMPPFIRTEPLGKHHIRPNVMIWDYKLSNGRIAYVLNICDQYFY